MAEVHIIGQLIGAQGFPNLNLFCKWEIKCGGGWKVVSGLQEGQTQVDHPSFEEFAYWCHPIDIHFATKGIQGWPKVHLEVYQEDSYNRSELVGYGCCHIPSSAGTHQVTCATWRPLGSTRDRLRQYFVGGGPQLTNPDLVSSTRDRFRLTTETMGTVHLELTVILRNFTQHGIES
ncbi:hypothetical protein B566_EDAN017680 [Ephemera danica]|nr:hypothetical protein B566_EDAN017680 [Ephemera danica]